MKPNETTKTKCCLGISRKCTSLGFVGRHLHSPCDRCYKASQTILATLAILRSGDY